MRETVAKKFMQAGGVLLHNQKVLNIKTKDNSDYISHIQTFSD
jgi:hypothetical protein